MGRLSSLLDSHKLYNEGCVRGFTISLILGTIPNSAGTTGFSFSTCVVIFEGLSGLGFPPRHDQHHQPSMRE